MKRPIIFSIAMAALIAAAPAATAAHHGHGKSQEHIILSSDEVEWKDGPASLESGAQFAVLEGDPSKEGMFTMRLKLPAGFRISPHTHPKVERVTVLEGEMKLGRGREFDEGSLESLPPGSFFAMPPGMEHFAAFGEETVVQLNAIGPWEIEYINPEDDPRR